MTKRFVYERLTAEEFNAALSELGMPRISFVRLFGINEKTASSWSLGDQDIPPWVGVVLAILQNCPGAIAEARKAASEIISEDRNRPGVRYPFLNTGEVETA